jgi:large subunit ribosomal protein L4
MTLDVVNTSNEKVGSVELDEAVFAGPIKADLIWESVVRQNASERRGTHKAKNRALVSGSGKKPYKQKGTGRPQVGSTRTPLWRHGGTVFPPQPRSYDYAIPKKVERGALRAALMSKLRDGSVVVVDELRVAERKTKAAVEVLTRLGVPRGSKTLIVDLKLDDTFARSARNVAGVTLVASGRLSARDVIHAGRIIATRAAVERLQEVLG